MTLILHSRYSSGFVYGDSSLPCGYFMYVRYIYIYRMEKRNESGRISPQYASLYFLNPISLRGGEDFDTSLPALSCVEAVQS